MTAIPDTTRVSRKNVAYLFGVHVTTVSRWAKTGFPRNNDGTYDLKACITHALTAAEEMSGQQVDMEATEQAAIWLAKFREERAKMAKLERERLEGRLVVAAEVEKRAFELGRKVRDYILNIPSRLGAIFAAESDHRKIEEQMDTELRKALEEMPDAIGDE